MDGVPRAKLDTMAQMLREQQKELRESYTFSAACKLLVVVGRRSATSLALALGAWRVACTALAAQDVAAVA